jgi:hypothetical protein
MPPPTRRPSMTRATATAAATVLTGVAMIATAGAASADTHVHATYKVTGSTFLKGPNATLALGPGTLSSNLDANTGKLTAKLTLPPATGSFMQFGVIPVTATAQFINDGPTTGTLKLKTGVVKTTSKVTLRIVSLTVAGIPIPVGTACQTTNPVVVSVKSQVGFSVLKGGNLAGTYTIGDFGGCGLATLLINITIPATGNSITLHLGKAKIG